MPVHASAAVRPEAPAADRHRRLVLVALYVGQMMITIDNTVVNVALPVIQRELHFSPASLAWVINAYLITFGGCLLLAGRLGDLLGRKPVFIAGLIVFTGASLACGLAGSGSVLIVARLLQGLGAAADTAMILGIIIGFYPDPGTRAHAMGLYAFVNLTGGSLGLLLGGVVTEAFSWHWIFFINLPIGLFALAVCSSRLRRDRGVASGTVDVAGALLITGIPMLLVYALVGAADRGWTAAPTVGCLAGAAGLSAVFVVLESRLDNPLIPLRIMRYRNLLTGNLIRGLVGLGTFGVFYLGVLYMQHVRGYSATATGLAYTPFTVTSAIIALFIGPRIMDRIGPKPMLVGGLAAFAAGMVLWTQVPVGGSYVGGMLPALLVTGIGGGFLTAPNIALCIASAPPEESGLVSALVSVSLQLGAGLGIAVLASVAATRSHHLLSRGGPVAPALTAGYHLGFVVDAAGMAVATVMALALRPSPTGRSRLSRRRR